MRLFLLTALTMVAFAANSVLNRMALAGGHSEAIAFATIRLFAGALMLAILCWMFRGGLRLFGPGRLAGVLALLVYIYGFSAAYNALDAGLGALILFGMVQVTMFASALKDGEVIAPARWIGVSLALGGLAWLVWPNSDPGADAQVSLVHGGFMVLAGVAWGVYSLVGRIGGEPLQATAANFLLAAPVGVAVWAVWPATGDASDSLTAVVMNWQGLALAVTSGAITSGLGYALWYSVLPQIQASAAAVAQLTVPVIALAAGVALLGENITWQISLASALVLGGVAISSLAGKRT